MPESNYDVIQLIGTSNESWEKAAANAVELAAKSLRDVSTAVGIQATAAEQKQASSSSVEAAREARFSIAP
jgi:flavin-binding protein dodecin